MCSKENDCIEETATYPQPVLQVCTTYRSLTYLDWGCYSNRQETRMKMGGFLGEIAFKGDFEKSPPFIILGEYIHVGKGTSIGLGKYEI